MPIALIFLMKSVVFLTYERINCVVGGVRKLSTNCEIFSVGQPFADTIGLPGGFFFTLVYFWEQIETCILHSLSVRYMQVLISISPLETCCLYISKRL